MKTISINVSDETAKRYLSMSSDRRRLVTSLLDRVLAKERTLLEIMDDMSEQAKRNGLTPEKLDEILKEE